MSAMITTQNILETIQERSKYTERYSYTNHSRKSSSRMRVMNHNWSATKQRLHPQSVAEISRHPVLNANKDLVQLALSSHMGPVCLPTIGSTKDSHTQSCNTLS